MADKAMKQFVCEVCGSTDLVKTDGVFVCQSCGCKYTVEEVRKSIGISENVSEAVVDIPGQRDPAAGTGHKSPVNRKYLIILGIFVGAFLISMITSGGHKASPQTPSVDFVTRQSISPAVKQSSSAEPTDDYQLAVVDGLPYALTYTSGKNAATFYIKDFTYTSSETFGMSKLAIEVTLGDADITWLRNDDPKNWEGRPYVAFWAEFRDTAGNVIAKSCFTPIITVNGPDITVSDTLFSTVLPQGTYDVAFTSARP